MKPKKIQLLVNEQIILVHTVYKKNQPIKYFENWTENIIQKS